MNYIINFLSIVIIWSVVYYFINNTETFTTLPGGSTQSCPFEPWGIDIQSCINRCIVSGLSNNNEMAGCKKENCTDICNKCDDKEYCEWIVPSENIINIQKKDNIICIPGNKEILVKLYDSNNSPDSTNSPNSPDSTISPNSPDSTDKKPPVFIVQYFKTVNPNEGIKIEKIKAEKKNASNIYKHTIENIENDVEYSVSFYPLSENETENTDNIIDTIKNTNVNISEIVKVTPSENNIIF